MIGEGAMMIIFMLLSVLAGALLGTQFRFAVLIPAMLVSSIVILSFGFSRGEAIWSIVVLECLVLTGLQLGYLATGTLMSAYIGRPDPIGSRPEARRRNC
jgi:hypothetical protein